MGVRNKGEKYRCIICGNEVMVTDVGGGTLMCCKKEMMLTEPGMRSIPEEEVEEEGEEEELEELDEKEEEPNYEEEKEGEEEDFSKDVDLMLDEH